MHGKQKEKKIVKQVKEGKNKIKKERQRKKKKHKIIQ